MSDRQTLSSLVDEAITVMREYEPAEGYFLAFSGGKDSVVLYDLAVKAGVKFTAFYNNTMVDPPQLRRFILTNYPTVVMLPPKKSFWRLVEENGIPTFRRKFCSRYLKDLPSNSVPLKVRLLGIRAEESIKRKNRGMISTHHCLQVKPLFNFTTDHIWEYIRSNNLKYCELYDHGFTRLGCIICPFTNKYSKLMYYKWFPGYFKAFYICAMRYYERNHYRLNIDLDYYKSLMWWLAWEDGNGNM